MVSFWTEETFVCSVHTKDDGSQTGYRSYMLIVAKNDDHFFPYTCFETVATEVVVVLLLFNPSPRQVEGSFSDLSAVAEKLQNFVHQLWLVNHNMYIFFSCFGLEDSELHLILIHCEMLLISQEQFEE